MEMDIVKLDGTYIARHEGDVIMYVHLCVVVYGILPPNISIGFASWTSLISDFTCVSAIIVSISTKACFNSRYTYWYHT
jgi:hypothetical protein